MAAALLASAAFASTDVPDTDSDYEAITTLTELGIMEGFEDGSFRPDDTITRAEAAKVMVLALSGEPSPGVSPFLDIPEDTEGWINAAYDLEIINGCSDGTFRPDDPAAYEEAVKMIVRTLGYEPIAAARGGYPTGYLSAASQYHISTGSGGKPFTPVTRRQFAIMLYNALEVKIFNPNDWGNELNCFPERSKSKPDTLLYRLTKSEE